MTSIMKTVKRSRSHSSGPTKEVVEQTRLVLKTKQTGPILAGQLRVRWTVRLVMIISILQGVCKASQTDPESPDDLENPSGAASRVNDEPSGSVIGSLERRILTQSSMPSNGSPFLPQSPESSTETSDGEVSDDAPRQARRKRRCKKKWCRTLRTAIWSIFMGAACFGAGTFWQDGKHHDEIQSLAENYANRTNEIAETAQRTNAYQLYLLQDMEHRKNYLTQELIKKDQTIRGKERTIGNLWKEVAELKNAADNIHWELGDLRYEHNKVGDLTADLTQVCSSQLHNAEASMKRLKTQYQIDDSEFDEVLQSVIGSFRDICKRNRMVPPPPPADVEGGFDDAGSTTESTAGNPYGIETEVDADSETTATTAVPDDGH